VVAIQISVAWAAARARR